MLTIFSTCKPFKNEFELIQKNAITSWTKLDKNIEIIIFGSEEGVEEICQKLSQQSKSSTIKNIKNVKRHNGLPILREIFYETQKKSRHNTLCYTNADIVFVQGLLETITAIKRLFNIFLIVGTRFDVKIDYEVDFNNTNWRNHLMEYAKKNGRYYQTNRGFDYFIFPKGLFYNLPPFVIGRVGWDNHFFAKILKKRIPVFDATESIFAIHQEHTYSTTPGGYKEVWYGTGSQYNINLLNKTDTQYSLFDTSFKIVRNGNNRYKIIPNYLGIKRHLTRTIPNLKYLFRGMLK